MTLPKIKLKDLKPKSKAAMLKSIATNNRYNALLLKAEDLLREYTPKPNLKKP